MSYRSKIEIVRYKQITTEEDCYNAFGTDADTPAVYAWFRDLTLSSAVLTSKDDFVDTVLRLFENPLSEERRSRVKPFYEVGLTIKPNRLSSKKENSLRHYATNEDIREEIGKALEAMIFWQVPLYIGKTKRLVDRILDHVNRETNLADRLEMIGLDIQDCLLAYMPISNRHSEEPSLIPLEQLVEDIITRLSTPGFVRRTG